MSRAHTIFREGDRASGFFIVRSGLAKVFRKHPDGRKTVQGIAGPGQVLGLVEVLTGARLQSSAQALDDCEIEYVDPTNFAQILETNRDLRTGLLEVTSQIENSREELLEFAGVPTTPR